MVGGSLQARPQIIIIPSISPHLLHVTVGQNTPCPCTAPSDLAPWHPITQPAFRSSCVSSPSIYAAVDIQSSIFHPRTAPVRLALSCLPHNIPPHQNALCKRQVVPIDFLSCEPSPHHFHTFPAYHLHSPRGQSLKPQPAARAVEDAIE